MPQFLPRVSVGWVACLSVLLLPALGLGAERSQNTKPVLLYSRHYNAEGETRYLPDGTFSDVLQRLRDDNFDVQTHNRPLDAKTLHGVDVVLIANPSDKAVGNHPAPAHFSNSDIAALTKFVEAGGALILMGNQENHNLEIEDTNKLLAHFGIQFTNVYTDAKKLVLPKETAVIGGLRWAYYTGNQLQLEPGSPAKSRVVVNNDLLQTPLGQGKRRDEPGVLLAAVERGRGRVIVVTDSGWVTNDALSEKGIGDVAIKGQDNWEIFRRLTRWAGRVGD